MGFVERAFTPPGTGGQEAAAIQAQATAQSAIQAANQRMATMKQLSSAEAPQPPKAPAAPPQFQAGSKQQKAATTATVLGSKAVAGEVGRKVSVLG